MGRVLRSSHSFSARASIRPEELLDKPLLMPSRVSVQEKVLSWFGPEAESVFVTGTYNLLSATPLLASSDLVYLIGIRGAGSFGPARDLVFVPFEPLRSFRTVVAWRRDRHLDSASFLFLQYLKTRLPRRERQAF